MMIVAISVVFIWLCFLIGLLVFNRRKGQAAELKESPFVSIIISLRNEEVHVQSLCESLAKLTYPVSKYEILLGNDASTDQTSLILERNKPKNAFVYHFSEEETGAFGKQKVLKALVSRAKGDYFLFTDADMIFHPEWIQAMLSEAQNGFELVLGLTSVSGNTWFDKIQNLDWLFHEKIVAWFSNYGIGLTAWGNNMMISRKAFNVIGGYEHMNDSIVEDVELCRKIMSNNGRMIVNTNPKASGKTQPVSGIEELLHQRKRWIKGMVGVNWTIWIGVLVKLLFWPALFYMVGVNSLWGLGIVLAFLLKMVVFLQLSKGIKKDLSLITLIIFETYELIFYLITFAFCLLPIRTKWKGRVY